jgi:hypothetical protein
MEKRQEKLSISQLNKTRENDENKQDLPLGLFCPFQCHVGHVFEMKVDEKKN